MQNEDNKDIRNTPFVTSEANHFNDEIYEGNEIFIYNEGNRYNEFDGFDAKIKTKAKTIGTIAGVGISSMGLLTFFVAIIFSMMMNNQFHPSVTNPKIEVKQNKVEYSFSFTNPYGIMMYCDLENENKESLSKTKITGYGNFKGEFINLNPGEYTLVVYSAQYGSKVYYYTSDIIQIN